MGWPNPSPCTPAAPGGAAGRPSWPGAGPRALGPAPASPAPGPGQGLGSPWEGPYGLIHALVRSNGPWARPILGPARALGGPWEALFGPPFEQALNSHMAKPMESLTQSPRTLPEGPQNRAPNRAQIGLPEAPNRPILSPFWRAIWPKPMESLTWAGQGLAQPGAQIGPWEGPNSPF